MRKGHLCSLGRCSFLARSRQQLEHSVAHAEGRLSRSKGLHGEPGGITTTLAFWLSLHTITFALVCPGIERCDAGCCQVIGVPIPGSRGGGELAGARASVHVGQQGLGAEPCSRHCTNLLLPALPARLEVLCLACCALLPCLSLSP